MIQYMLDTDISSYIMKGQAGVVEESEKRRGSWCISAIVYQELVAGLIGSKGTRLEPAYEHFLRFVDVLPFSMSDALVAAEVSVSLRKNGINIGHRDEQIAGHAMSAGLTLVTNNFKHFKPIAGLSSESWA
ncbi:MAG: type II toxin-antitoxin system VapC family toxin [Micrococcales bacterium]